MEIERKRGDRENKRPTLIRQKQTMMYKDNGEERTGLIKLKAL